MTDQHPDAHLALTIARIAFAQIVITHDTLIRAQFPDSTISAIEDLITAREGELLAAIDADALAAQKVA